MPTSPWRVPKYNTVSGSNNGGSDDDDELPETAGWLTKE